MAKNAWLGLELTRDLRALDLVGFLSHLNAHTTWPFGFSLLLVPFLLVGGASFSTATMVSLLSFALLPLAALALARRVEPGGAGMIAGGAAGALLLSSPLLATFALLVMRESTGLLLTLVASALFLSARQRASLAASRLAAAGFLALFFVKYNYALLWLVATALDWAIDMPVERRRRWRDRLAAWSPLRRDGSTPARALAASLVVLVATQLAGGSAGNVLFALLWLWTLALAPIAWRRRGELRRRLAALSPATRAGLEVVVAPLWLWSLALQPIHPKGVLDFLVNRESGAPFLERAARYLAGFDGQFTPTIPVALLVATGCVLGATFAVRRSSEARFLALQAAVPLALTLAHPYAEERFLLTSLGAVFLLAGLGWAAMAERFGRLGLAAAGVALVTACGFGFVQELVPPTRSAAELYISYSGSPALRHVVAALPEIGPLGRRVAVLGTFNELGQELVYWGLTANETNDARDASERQFVRPPGRFAADASPAVVEAEVDDWLQRKRPDTVVVVVPLSGSGWRSEAEYREYSAWQELVARSLAERPGWRVAGRRRFRGPGVEVAVFRLSQASER